jgi:hypothetical protein
MGLTSCELLCSLAVITTLSFLLRIHATLHFVVEVLTGKREEGKNSSGVAFLCHAVIQTW